MAVTATVVKTSLLLKSLEPPRAYEFIVSRSGSQDDLVGVYSSAISGLGNLYEKSKSPPCRKERDKDGATPRMITWKGWASLPEQFQRSFLQAAENADAIRFDVTHFDPGYPGESMSSWEFENIVSNESFLQKTTFVQNGQPVTWNGVDFDPIP